MYYSQQDEKFCIAYTRERDDVALHWVVDMFFRRLSNHSLFLSPPFPSIFFLHGLAVHALYVTSPGYTLSGVASDCDSVVKSWAHLLPAGGLEKVYYSLAIPVTSRWMQDMRLLAYGPSERKFTNVRWPTCRGSVDEIRFYDRASGFRRALIESNNGSRKYGDRVKPRSR